MEVMMPQPPYPLHESVVGRLADEYVDFYNRFLINLQQVHYQSLAASRRGGAVPGGSAEVPVAQILDLSIERRESTGAPVPIRVFVPEGQAPEGGWPVMLYYHGGGWVLGEISTEQALCTKMCVRARAVVITTDYR
jgi:acetyl esterase/lipase